MGHKVIREIVGEPYYDNSGNGYYDEWFGVENEYGTLTFRRDGVEWLESVGLNMSELPGKVRLRVEIEILETYEEKLEREIKEAV